jgi:hypothetical protein
VAVPAQQLADVIAGLDVVGGDQHAHIGGSFGLGQWVAAAGSLTALGAWSVSSSDSSSSMTNSCFPARTSPGPLVVEALLPLADHDGAEGVAENVDEYPSFVEDAVDADHLDQSDEPVVERADRGADVRQQDSDGDAGDGADDNLEPKLANQRPEPGSDGAVSS